MPIHSFFEKKRTWSRIKDELLKAYLAPYLAKVSKTHKPIIVADCFAGKGRFDDGEPGSPLIITEAISSQLSDLSSPEIKAIFIEKKYFRELKTNLPAYHWINALEGDYQDRIEYFIRNYNPRQRNLFLYVDPYGIKNVLFSYFEAIAKKQFRTVELLLNLNSLGFLREGCRLLKYPVSEHDLPDVYEHDVITVERLDEIAGGQYWREILKEFYSHRLKMQEAEEQFITKYCDRLRQVFRYVINIPIKTNLDNIPKYRMVFGTNHEDGLLLMVDNMNNRWASFREEARDRQSPLFECDLPDPNHLQAAWNIEENILSFINDEVELKELLVRLVEAFGISFSTRQYKEALKKMKGNQVDVRWYPPETPTGKPRSSWDHTTNDFKIMISRRSGWQPSLL
ncbi:hypothetical protein GEOBRER4_n4015 [Citrifermentans bremense]|uniref:Three-Cys-motif partner protein TcmP n=1 Tax=Citrifermentans bremense TaxID=60035 RepID=A0A6S6M465_9BACT|nr:three-Cys-motif partner protein TcmP [Citrifermentans bremense]BCG49112.1 hypothetical protein GEOBRER4_n4015 [Citrifermentans bremense]